MKKPEGIVRLEKITRSKNKFRKIDLTSIISSHEASSFLYSSDENNSITGLRIENVKSSSLGAKLLKEISKLDSLARLSLKHNDLEDISYLSNIPSLQYLDLSYNKICNASHLSNLKALKEIDLSNNLIENTSFIQDLQNLEFIWLANNNIKDISTFEKIEDKSILTKLGIGGNRILDYSYLKDFNNLNELNLAKSNICDLDFFEEYKCSYLRVLSLAGNNIQNIDPLKKNVKLKYLDLRHNQIQKLSDFICDWDMEVSMNDKISNTYRVFYFYDNPIKNPPLEIIQQGKAALKAYFEEQKKTKSIPNPYVKLILTGNTTVGKTSFINFLTDRFFIEGEISTHGICQTAWNPIDTELNVNVLDFGGQEYYHSTHQLFFSNNALYLLLFDKQHNCNGWLKTEIDYADKGKVKEELEHFDYFYWLRNIRNLSDKSKILLLQNKVESPKDKVYPSNDVFDESMEYKVDDFQTTSILNAYSYYKENQRLSPEFEELQKLIVQKLNEVKRGEIFEYYMKAKDLIESASQSRPVVSIDEFIEICKPANENIDKVITDENGKETEYTAWKLMCVYFHETGALLYYPDSPTLKGQIFIRPTYVTDSIYKVLNYKVKQNSGRFSFEDAADSLENPDFAEDIIELMSAPNFKLIFEYPPKSKNYIAPQYLPDRKKDEDYHAISNMQTGFVLYFTRFLPKYILTEFLVKYGAYQQQDKIWKYGLLFDKYDCTAFVECDMKAQTIVFKSFENGNHLQLKEEVFSALRKIYKDDKSLKIALDEKHEPYNLETVLRDDRNELFRLYRIGYQAYQQELEMTIDKMIDRKLFLEKELLMAIDPNAKYSLKLQVEQLNEQIDKHRK